MLPQRGERGIVRQDATQRGLGVTRAVIGEAGKMVERFGEPEPGIGQARIVGDEALEGDNRTVRFSHDVQALRPQQFAPLRGETRRAREAGLDRAPCGRVVPAPCLDDAQALVGDRRIRVGGERAMIRRGRPVKVEGNDIFIDV